MMHGECAVLQWSCIRCALLCLTQSLSLTARGTPRARRPPLPPLPALPPLAAPPVASASVCVSQTRQAIREGSSKPAIGRRFVCLPEAFAGSGSRLGCLRREARVEDRTRLRTAPVTTSITSCSAVWQTARPWINAHREGGLSLPDLVLLPLRNIDDEIASKSSRGSLPSTTRPITQTSARARLNPFGCKTLECEEARTKDSSKDSRTPGAKAF